MPERSALLLAQYSLDPSYTVGLMDKGDTICVLSLVGKIHNLTTQQCLK